MRLNIFPGSATPAGFAAGAAFWIGYGFVPESGEVDAEQLGVDAETRFELEVDGEPVALVCDVKIEGGRTILKVSAASFPTGLPAGWHRFAGRWYDAGKLVLTSDKTIEFVERR
jgi:hypothetical protein